MTVLSRWPGAADRELLEVVRALPSLPASLEAGAEELVRHAEVHGLADVVYDAWREAGAKVGEAVERDVLSRRIARELDHDAHVAMLHRIDEALEGVGLRGVLLKGALFAERYYPRPAARGTSDIDLLVREADVDRAAAALRALGYRASDDPAEARFRREHHHLHLAHDRALPLELHFHAYRGFGEIMRSEPLLERSVAVPSFAALRVLSKPDELVYLAVHAAAHRFGRLSWLYDIKLLVEAMTDAELAAAAARARDVRYGRALGFAAMLLAEGLGVSPARLRPLGDAGLVRGALLGALAPEPEAPLLRAATRFAYSLALCDSAPGASRYARHATGGFVRRALGRDR